MSSLKGVVVGHGTLAAALVLIALAGAVFVGGDTSLTRFSDSAAGNSSPAIKYKSTADDA